MKKQNSHELDARTLHQMYRKLRSWDRQTQMMIDLVVLVLAFWLAYLLRFDFLLERTYFVSFLTQLPLVVLVQVVAAYAMGIYSFIWRFVGLTELKAFAKAMVIAPVPLLALRFGLSAEQAVWKTPLSIILIDTLLAFGGMLAIRVLRRVLHERRNAKLQGSGRSPDQRVLILGAGHAGVSIAREIGSRGDTGLDAIGFLDDDRAKQGSVVGGARVLGTLADLSAVASAHDVDQIILTITSAPRQRIRKIVDLCEAAHLPLRVVPALSQILDGSVGISRLRPVQIEDLLGRDPVQLDTDKLKAFLSGKRILITGAGGSIGSEIARQVLQFDPSTLLLLERAEYPLFELLREFDSGVGANKKRLIPLVADAGDEARMRTILATHRPQVIIHAAAHKHVPLMELNACEAIRNNVAVTAKIAQLAADFECETFVLISTDKAVRPTSVMGATKRVAEMLILDQDRESTTRFVAVRFGNVLGSTGSVIPIFEGQIAQGGPVKVTHPDMVRYFMTIPEASQLVLQAGSYGRGGEILILDMGEPVPIVRLAEDMIRLSGLKPYEDIDITFSGARPGEKVVEELTLDPAELKRTRHPKIFVSAPLITGPTVTNEVTTLIDLAALGLERDAREQLSKLVPDATLAQAPAAQTGHKSSEPSLREHKHDRAGKSS